MDLGDHWSSSQCGTLDESIFFCFSVLVCLFYLTKVQMISEPGLLGNRF